MILRAMTWVCFVGLLLAANQSLSATELPEPPVVDLPPVVHTPSLQDASTAFNRSGLPSVAAEVRITYDAQGNVLSAEMAKKSGNRPLDKELLIWARKFKLKPGTAGTGIVPVNFKVTVK